MKYLKTHESIFNKSTILIIVGDIDETIQKLLDLGYTPQEDVEEYLKDKEPWSHWSDNHIVLGLESGVFGIINDFFRELWKKDENLTIYEISPNDIEETLSSIKMGLV